MELAQARILVVGATGELGQRLADRFAHAGGRLVLTGRNAERLTTVAGRTRALHAVTLDLLDVDAITTAVDEAAHRLGGLDVVLIATGVAAFGPAVADDDAVVEELFAVNTLGPMAVIRAALPHLERGGAIAVLTAILADLPTAGMAAYSASKAGLAAYLDALRRELRRDGISVLDARPPHLETGLADRALAGDPPRMPPGHDIDEVVEAIVRGIVEAKSELVADPRAHTIQLR